MNSKTIMTSTLLHAVEAVSYSCFVLDSLSLSSNNATNRLCRMLGTRVGVEGSGHRCYVKNLCQSLQMR